jgi:hypothetical protein
MFLLLYHGGCFGLLPFSCWRKRLHSSDSQYVDSEF